MTATDELRDGLTKRGIKWRWEDERTTYWYVTVDGEEWGEWTAIEMGGYLHLSFSSGDVLTPAQAIAATLGAETCHLKPWEMERDTGFYDSMECDCGYVADVADWASWHFCPSCGRQNVGVDE